MPRKHQQSLQRLAEERRDAGARASVRWVDLQLDVYDEISGERIHRFGGRWDKAAKEFDDEPAKLSREIELHVGQIPTARWFDWWLEHHIAGDLEADELVFDALLAGGRRGGKTFYGMLAAVGYAISIPGSIVWIVTPSDAFFGEPIFYLEDIMPAAWYTSLGAPHWTYFLANGSQIVIRSGHTPKRLKQGKADFIVIQEGQAVPVASYNTLSASIVDSGGLVMTTANPPDVGDPGEWVRELARGAQLGTNNFARYFFFDPELNPHINQVTLRALALKYDQHTYDVQVRGMFLLPPDSVLYGWDQALNEMLVPQMHDVTRKFTKHFEGREFDDIVGVDVQNFPWIAGVRVRAFANPEAPNDMEQAFLFCVGEVFLEKGDEIVFAYAMQDATNFRPGLGGCVGKNTLVICDASGRWQQQKRKEDEQRTEFKGKGKGSFDLLIAGGFPSVVPPDALLNSNPDVIERCRAANARIRTAVANVSETPKRYLFADPEGCPQTVESITRWRTDKHGKPSRSSLAAHGGDALTYVTWRFFPRRNEKRNVEIKTGFGKKFQGRNRTKGWTR